MTVVMRPPLRRRATRQELVLKIEFDEAAGFRSNYLPDLPDGGIRIGSSMEVGQQFHVSISFPGFLGPLRVLAVVRWSLPAAHPDGPAAGLGFVDPSPEAAAWLAEVLDGSTQIYLIDPEPSDRVPLLEAQPFLRDVYGQEVRNWAELRDEAPVEVIAHEDPAAWLEEIARAPSTLAIVDIDGLETTGLELYRRVRAAEASAELPLIVIGAPASIEPFSEVSDDLLFCLRKPLRFGVLMNTVRVLAQGPPPAPLGAAGEEDS